MFLSNDLFSVRDDQAAAKRQIFYISSCSSWLKINLEVWQGLEILIWPRKYKSLWLSPHNLLTREDLPVPQVQHLLPDDLPHDLCAYAKQHGEWGVRVIEAVQQNLWHLSFLLPYQPGKIRMSLRKKLQCKQAEIIAEFKREIEWNICTWFLYSQSSSLPSYVNDFKNRITPEKLNLQSELLTQNKWVGQ